MVGKPKHRKIPPDDLVTDNHYAWRMRSCEGKIQHDSSSLVCVSVFCDIYTIPPVAESLVELSAARGGDLDPLVHLDIANGL